MQWLTAGRGVVHAEMPAAGQGVQRGINIWINLSADDKMYVSVSTMHIIFLSFVLVHACQFAIASITLHTGRRIEVSCQ